jgi:carboxymethylenebutenolidase
MAVYHHFAQLDAPDGSMPTYIVAPEAPGPHPGVLVIQGMHGANAFELEVAERFAQHGCVAAVPDLFYRGPACFSFEELDRRRRAFTDARMLADVNTAVSYLKEQPYVRPGGFGILGFCMGGRVSYLMAATSPDIRVAADFYGGGVLKGEGGPSPFELTRQIRCPILIFDGEEDAHPSPEEVRTIGAELERHGVTHEVHIYPGVGHAFMSRREPGPRQQAIDDAWSHLLAWFQRYLIEDLAVSRS